MIVYLQNLKKSMNKATRTNKWVTKAMEHKINIQKSIFLYLQEIIRNYN